MQPNTPSNSKACFMLYQHTAEENARRQLDRVTAAEAFPPQPEGATRSLYYVDSRVLGGGDSLPLQRGPASIFEQVRKLEYLSRFGYTVCLDSLV